jgi:hypothetical protein
LQRRSLTVDAPAAATVSQPFTIEGWAIVSRRRRAPIDAINAFAYPIGSARRRSSLDGRPAAGRAVTWARHTSGRFTTRTSACWDGSHPVRALEIYTHSTATNRFQVSQRLVVTVRGRPRMNVDLPGNQTAVGRGFRVAGWALDLESTSGSGVDAIHVYAYPAAGGAPLFLGVATLGFARPDVATAFSRSDLTDCGFNLDVNSLGPGAYDVVVFAHSSVSGTFSNAQRRITVQ